MSKKKDKPRKLKRATIKEELVALTGDYVKALLLQQFIYWSDRMDDCESFIEEELKRIESEEVKVNILESSGWIYKTAAELSEELMLGMSPATIGRHMKHLLDNGWILERNNPEKKWDRTKQYRVDLIKIQVDLLAKGYFLEGYQVHEQAFFILKNAIFKMKNGDFNLKTPTVDFEKAIPENTSEITTEKDRLIDSGKAREAPSSQPQSSDGMPFTVPGAVREEISLSDCLGRIEECYVGLRGKFMNDKDYKAAVQLIKSGIPLQTILDGIVLAFENKKKSQDSDWNEIRSLAYCAKAVRQLHYERTARAKALQDLERFVPDQEPAQQESAATAESVPVDPAMDEEMQRLLEQMKGGGES